MIHGIAVRNRHSNKLEQFIKCETGKRALVILAGIRTNLGDDFKAIEEFIQEKELLEMEK